jgi:hypothetical protein
MPNPFKTMKEQPAKSLAVFAVAMCVGFGTCGVAVATMHGGNDMPSTLVALFGGLVCFLALIGLLVTLLLLLIEAIRRSSQR